jgi:hypothetical protein
MSMIVSLEPTFNCAGATKLMATWSMLKVAGSDVPPLGAGLVTVICTVPNAFTSAAVTETDKLLLFMNCVFFGVPFHCTIEAGKNPVPRTVKTKSATPAETDAGLRDAITGTG